MPDKISEVVQLWRNQLSTVNEKAGQSLADPKEYDNLFPGLQDALRTQQFMQAERSTLMPAHMAATTTPNWEKNLVEEMQKAQQTGSFVYNDPVSGIPKDLDTPRYVI